MPTHFKPNVSDSSECSPRETPATAVGHFKERELARRSDLLLAENAESTYTAYVSEQNLLPDGESGAVRHPQVKDMFVGLKQGRYELRKQRAN